MPGKDGINGRDGIDGKDGSAGEQGPEGKPGRDGADGKDGAPGAAGRDGVDGKDGRDGATGAAGKDVDPEFIRAEIATAVKQLPAAKDGRDGKDAAPVDVDSIVKSVLGQIRQPTDGKDGIDGKSISIEDVRQLLESAVSHQALEFERRNSDILQRTIDEMRQKVERAIDVMPAPKDGRDAFDLDDIDLTQSDDGRTVTLAFRRGGEVREKSFKVLVIVDRGVWRHETPYSKGDSVSFSGSLWIAQKDNPGKPDEDKDGWRLAVKRGRDGRDGK
jgi:integrin beta 3